MKSSFGALKLRTQLENLMKAPTHDNAILMLNQMKQMENENFQFVQDLFLTTLLTLMDEAKGL